ncbi:hypothetical protein, partial [Romboutsia sp.]|uniref:hypothetical protein n=1 Tax=Romboutsia sp. TaxID=1965302 RepID=UPI003F416BEB
AKKLLNSAENWSTLDMFGGGLISSMAKHSKIDDAQMQFSRISNLVKSFNKELEDVNLNGVGFSSTTKTFDIFFDNIFSDLSVNRHITESYEDVCKLERSVNNIINSLNINKDRLNMGVISKTNEYDEFVKSIN